MLKGVLGGVYHELKTLKTINKVHWLYYYFFSDNRKDICQPKSNQLNFHYYLCSFGIQKLSEIAV